MAKNPLFPTNDDDQTSDKAAADLVRYKLDYLYEDAPDASEELDEVRAKTHHLSKHQRYMRELQTSGQSLAAIQTAWHNYYVALPEAEKLQVWQEFYDTNQRASHYEKFVAKKPELRRSKLNGASEEAVIFEHRPPHPAASKRGAKTIKSELKAHIAERAKAQAKKNSLIRSIGFGLSMGILVVIIFLFSFFNEVIIAPFIQPSRHVSATPLILGSSSLTASSTPEVIIPKINVEIPVNYSLATDDENVIENALEGGVVHYPSTVLPGQNGNAAYFGHSSNNILNPGKYKFAFVLLHTLVNGDTFYLTYQGKVFVYQVVDHKVVPPSDVSVLNDSEGHQATATLITCDPPGTSNNRLIVTGLQISPDPASNTNPGNGQAPVSQPQALASNGPSLWDRLWSWL